MQNTRQYTKQNKTQGNAQKKTKKHNKHNTKRKMHKKKQRKQDNPHYTTIQTKNTLQCKTLNITNTKHKKLKNTTIRKK